MTELTLESLAQRVECLERALHLNLPHPGKNDWQRVVGMFAGSDFMKRVDDEGRKIREAERAKSSGGANNGMILLDTDHVTLLKYADAERGARLLQRLQALSSDETVAVPIIVVEEQMRGWLAAIAKERKARRQVFAYQELAGLFEFFRAFAVTHFDERSANQFDGLRTAKVRLGTMDLKIAAIALVNGALLLSANRSDFERVPGLRVENWLE